MSLISYAYTAETETFRIYAWVKETLPELVPHTYSYEIFDRSTRIPSVMIIHYSAPIAPYSDISRVYLRHCIHGYDSGLLYIIKNMSKG